MFLLLENDMISGTQVGGLLKFPPVSAVIIPFPSFFHPGVLMITKISPVFHLVGLLRYLIVDI